MDRFGAPWDRALTISTVLAGLLLAGLALWLPGVGLLAPRPAVGPVVLRLVPLGLFALLAVTWAMAPRGFAIRGGELLLERRIGPVRIPLARVTAVRLLPSIAKYGTRRYAGTSGLFGYFGRYWSPSLGRFRLHATRRTRLVLVDTEDGRWVLSPEPPEAFVAALRRAAPRAVEAPAPGAGAEAAGRGRRVAVTAVLGVAALVAGGVLVAVAGATPRAARVTGDAVVVERRWFADVVIPLAEVRRVSALAPDQRRGWVRTAGTSLPGGVAYGRFASPALGSFRLYAWRPGPMVLLVTDRGPVVLTPDAPEAFLAEVRARRPTAAPSAGPPAAAPGSW